jgi:hypothetical protein
LKSCHMWDIPEKTWKLTPMRINWKPDLNSTLLNAEDITKFKSVLMKLSYLATRTRPDLSYAVNILAQRQVTPNKHDMAAVIRVLRYLRNTHTLGLYYRCRNNDMVLFEHDENSGELTAHVNDKVVGYADANFGEESDRKSRSGYVFMVFGCAVSWMSKKQSTIALSSTEAEYVALSEGIREALWYKNFLTEISVQLKDPIEMAQDNKSTIAIAVNPIRQRHVKHMDIKLKFIEEHIRRNDVVLAYCPTELMIADILTKPLPPKLFIFLRQLMGMCTLKEARDDNGSMETFTLQGKKHSKHPSFSQK